MPTERNNRQLSEISDAKLEETIERLWVEHYHCNVSGVNVVGKHGFRLALLELQRETRRETLLMLMDAMSELLYLRDMGMHSPLWSKRRDEINKFLNDAAELERKAKESDHA